MEMNACHAGIASSLPTGNFKWGSPRAKESMPAPPSSQVTSSLSVQIHVQYLLQVLTVFLILSIIMSYFRRIFFFLQTKIVTLKFTWPNYVLHTIAIQCLYQSLI